MRRNWREEARTAIKELAGVGHGSREAERRLLAKRISGHSDTSALRRAITAEEFLEKLRTTHPRAYSHLDGASISIVDALARWYAFDPKGALAAAEGWSQGIGNAGTIIDAMRKARPAGHGGKSGPTLEKAYVNDAKQAVVEAVGDLTGEPVFLSSVFLRDQAIGQTFDYLFDIEEAGGPRRVAVLVVGPYTNRKLYAARSGEWVIRAVGLALMFERVVLALPDDKALPDYRNKIEEVSRRIEQAGNPGAGRRPRVDVVHVDVSEFASADEQALFEQSGHHSKGR